MIAYNTHWPTCCFFLLHISWTSFCVNSWSACSFLFYSCIEIFITVWMCHNLINHNLIITWWCTFMSFPVFYCYRQSKYPQSHCMHENLFVKYFPRGRSRKMIYVFVTLIDTAKLSYLGDVLVPTCNRNKWINSFPTALPHTVVLNFPFLPIDGRNGVLV